MLYYEDDKLRAKIDKHLHDIAIINANLGIDSTPKEVARASVKKDRHLEKIKNLDEELYKRLVIEEDRSN